MSAGSTGKNSSGAAANFFQWLKVMSAFQEASSEIRGLSSALGKCPLVDNNDSAVRLSANPGGAGAFTHMDLSEAGDAVCGSLLSVVFCLIIWYMGRKEGAPGC